jgi:outer membrane protein assembly factor BamB
LAAVALVVTLSVSAFAAAADWPQWHGPNHDGIVPGDQPKVATWAAKGPLKVWDSPEIPSAGNGGLGSVVVAGDRAYLFGTPKFIDKLTERKLDGNGLRNLGWTGAKLPDDLSKLVEDARVSDERAKLQGKPWEEYIKKFDETNLTTPELKKLAGPVNERIGRGKGALPLDVLAKLDTVKDKPFKDEAEMKAWFETNGITDATAKAVMGQIPTTRERMDDTIYCLNAADGTLVWKKNYPGRVDGWGYSCTPCVADGKVFAVGSLGMVYCLNAKDGAEVWTAKAGASHSSFLVVDGLAIVQAGPLTAYEPATGKVVWTQPKVNTGTNSPTPWAKDGKSLLLCNTGRGAVSCVEVKTGNVLWTAPGGSDSTAAVSGDMMVVLTGGNLLGYRITAEKADKVWELPGGDRGASPMIYKGNAYVVSSGQVRCVSLADGKLLWTGKGNFREYTSPLVVDGKLVVVGDKGLSLVDTATDKFNLLASVPFDVSDVTTPAFANGKMYIRMHTAVSCYDVSQSAPVEAPATPKAK